MATGNLGASSVQPEFLNSRWKSVTQVSEQAGFSRPDPVKRIRSVTVVLTVLLSGRPPESHLEEFLRLRNFVLQVPAGAAEGPDGRRRNVLETEPVPGQICRASEEMKENKKKLQKETESAAETPGSAALISFS